MPSIIFNGKTYNSLDEMPAPEREAFQHLSSVFVDKDGNGIPDFMEGDVAKNVMAVLQGPMNINGQRYNSLNEMPPEMRTKLQSALEKLSQAGVTGADTPMIISSVQMNAAPMSIAASTPAPQTSSAIRDDKGPSWLWWGALAVVVALCLMAAAALAVYLYMQSSAG